jgi:hypothetical protein
MPEKEFVSGQGVVAVAMPGINVLMTRMRTAGMTRKFLARHQLIAIF